MVLARNTISGIIADVSPKMLEHPTFKDILEVVDEDAKNYIPEMYSSGTKSEKKAKRNDEPAIEETKIITNTEEEK
jgi:hypothetical protein